MSASRYRPPRGCLWPSLILGGLLLLVGGLSLLAIPKLWLRSQEEWTETAGTIVEPYVITGERIHSSSRKRRGRTLQHDTRKATFHVGLKYRYTVAGQDYAGDAPALSQPENDEDAQQAQAILPTYPTGGPLAVFHHPIDPNQSRLTLKEPALEFGLDVCFAFLFLLAGSGFIILGRWISRSTANVK